MPKWEYRVEKLVDFAADQTTFENYLNQLGRDEWELILLERREMQGSQAKPIQWFGIFKKPTQNTTDRS